MTSRPPGPWGLLQLFAAGAYGARWQTALWLKPDGALPGTFDIKACATSLYTAYGTAIASVMNSGNKLLGCRLYVNNGTYTTSYDLDTATLGALTGGALPPDDFIVVRMQAPVSGRNGKGRILISGLDLDIADNGRVNGTGDTAMTAMNTVFKTAQTGGGVTWNVQQYDHKNNVLHLPDFFTYNPVLGNKKKRSPIL